MSKRYQLNKNKYLSESEQRRLLEILESVKHKELRNVTLIRLALETGARATELLNLTRDDLDLEGNTVFITGIKNSNDREIPIKKSTMDDVFATAELNEENNKIFNISYSYLSKVWNQYRPNGKKFHSLRHTFAINVYKKTRDIRLTMSALGHRNIANTMIYIDYIYSKEELKKIIA